MPINTQTRVTCESAEFDGRGSDSESEYGRPGARVFDSPVEEPFMPRFRAKDLTLANSGPQDNYMGSPIPATISGDNTNKNLVIESLLEAVASRQSQGAKISQSDTSANSGIHIRDMPDIKIPPSPKAFRRDHMTWATSDETIPIEDYDSEVQDVVPSSRIEAFRKQSRSRGIPSVVNTPGTSLETRPRPRTPQNPKATENELPSAFPQRSTPERGPQSLQESVSTKPSSSYQRASIISNGNITSISKVANCCSDLVCTCSPSELSPQLTIPNGSASMHMENVESLREKIKQLESQVTKLQRTDSLEKQTLYRICCGGSVEIWLDKPRAMSELRKSLHYEADIPIPDVKAYFRRNSHIHFVVYEDFECCGSFLTDPKELGYSGPPWARLGTRPGYRYVSNDVSTSIRELQFTASRGLTEHKIGRATTGNPFSITSIEFRDLIVALQNKAKIEDWSGGFRLYDQIYGPHNCILRHIGLIRAQISTFNLQQQHLLNLLFDFIEDRFGHEYQEAVKLSKEGYVAKHTIPYTICPGDVIVKNDKVNYLNAYIVETWPQVKDSGTRMASVSFKAWSWKFNGVFEKAHTGITLSLDLFEEDDAIEIERLEYYPIKYAKAGSKGFLKRRGLQFWRCRKRRFIGYSGWDAENNEQFVDARFMIDTMTYRKMHPQSALANEDLVDDLGDRIEDELPLEGNQILVFPPTIYGFHVQEKKWFDLKVDNLQDVSWNKGAFDSLVIDEKTKLLIVALVSNKISAEASTDLMSNKGNGLIILLHGAPGTGKTLTAGSVAEYAEKPLYRVTTGDVGTNPEAVEKYLTSVLYLGKIWGCVVLLDEADVFLEERTLSDLTRNALVSVFLRVLEYYDGILILTSNRVGTFDSAFKSRIQLAIHYDNLSHEQRIKIWQGFMKRLQDVASDDIDIEQLNQDKNIKKLARYNLNGRQIRNNITTARQLALFQKELMNMTHLETVIEVSQKFENYLRGVKAGLDDEQIAREDGVR
ncbi:hypothetical protein TWF481_001462 [Arthrobotrys musiformis]|uniref:AAA+ ATPase domain-containing protein n=1 Tax=Arthrobotrys musiformis TaxID=47236 RepID=A0AAV9WS97_9PEZI